MSFSATKRKNHEVPTQHADEENDSGEILESNDGSYDAPEPARERPAKKARLHDGRNITHNKISNKSNTGDAYHSNMFKLQMDELLRQAKPDYYAVELELNELLQSMKALVLDMPDLDDMTIAEAEAYLRARRVVIPFPSPRPRLDAKYKLAFKRPLNVNIAGSFSSKTMVRERYSKTVDFVIAMPQSLFQEKDYLNYRYFLKRAFYISCIAASIKDKDNDKLGLDVQFDYLNENSLLPILCIKSHTGNGTLKHWRVQIIPFINKDTFNTTRLLPSKNCVRNQSLPGIKEEKELKPTSFYNSSILADSLVTSYLKLHYEATSICKPLLDACLLGRIWLGQRGFGSGINSGGFGNFEWLTIASMLLQGGGPKNSALFSQGYNYYQLFKAMLQFFATQDLVTAPAVVDVITKVQFPKPDGTPYFFDGQRGHNVLYKMTPWSYKLLQHHAAISAAALRDVNADQFETTFISKVDYPLCQYDALLMIPVEAIEKQQSSPKVVLDLEKECNNLYKVVSRALNNRVKLINFKLPIRSAWETNELPSTVLTTENVIVGFLFDEFHINRTVDRGPSADSPKEAASFRNFWGDKAELRRFKDGSIVETVVWSSTQSSTFRQILSSTLSKHRGHDFVDSLRFEESSSQRFLPEVSTRKESSVDHFTSAITQLRELDQEIRALDDLPLHLRQMHAADPQLAYTSIKLPGLIHSQTAQSPANVVLQFEGSSRWPDDMDAIQRTKVAFLFKLAECLEHSNKSLICRVGLENEGEPLSNKAILDVTYQSGLCFRLRIHHDREATLLDRKLKNKHSSPAEKQESASALHLYRRSFIAQPAHTTAIQGLAIKYPSFSETVRLVKSWFSSHRLLAHFHESIIELFVARVYQQPSPWSSPTSPTSGLLRTLIQLSQWDWRHEPWVSNLSSESMSETETAAITTRFNAWRKIDPGLNRVAIFVASNVDSDGATWTDYAKPSKVLAARMTSLARSAVAVMREHGPQLNLETIFSSGTADFDFIIQLDASLANGTLAHSKKENNKYKNIHLQQGIDTASVGFDSIFNLVVELQLAFGDVMILFFDEMRKDVITGVWNPHTRRQWKLKLDYSSMPIGKTNEVEVNRDSILNEIARLGGRLIKSIKTTTRNR